ncbi:MAG: TetR/AcrR family transcriptional regulator [Pseudomonadota bacterium]
MQVLSASDLEQVIAQDRVDSACFDLALRAARAHLYKEQPGNEQHVQRYRLTASSTISFAPIGDGPIHAKVDVLSRKSDAQKVCRVTLSQSQPGSARKLRIAEATCTFMADLIAQETAQPAPAPEPAPKDALTDTAELRRKQIFDGACRVIARHGFGNATMREIAEEAGLSVSLMYKYIKDKDDILYLITSMSMQSLFDWFETEELQSGPADRNLQKAIYRYIDYIGTNRRYINLVYSESRSLSSEHRAKVFDKERAFTRRWEAIVRRGIAQGQFRPIDPELAANMIYFLCTIWSLRYWNIGKFDEQEVRSALTALIFDGLAVRPQATDKT